MKIILSGGGTLGPVVPLLAVVAAVQKFYPDVSFIWVGTKNGPEREIVEANGLKFFTIDAGKWRRYFSLLNLLDIIRTGAAFFQSLYLLVRLRPHLVISAGGFVSVPVHFAAAFLGIPSWVHQQDIRVGLANKLMFPLSDRVTTATRETAEKIGTKRPAEWIGNPSRDLSADPVKARARFNIPPGAPVVFALGGGTGSATINGLVLEALPQWPRDWHVIHLVGRERPRAAAEGAEEVFENYHAYQFFTDEMKDAYAAADVVIARAGFSTLTELASLSKPAVVIPMSGTHQEDNAFFFGRAGGVVVLSKNMTTGLHLAQTVKDLLASPGRRRALGEKLHELLPVTPPAKIAEIVAELTKRPAA